MTITIHGLSARQKVYADIFWTIPEQHQVIKFINSLPLSERMEAVTVLHLLVAAIHDNAVESTGC
jgi:hypothetical protein